VDEPFNPRSSLYKISFQVMVQLLLKHLESETSRAFVSAYRESVLQRPDPGDPGETSPVCSR
jgi:hypothetical protein